jgi:DNA-binding response OmpR family regulator
MNATNDSIEPNVGVPTARANLLVLDDEASVRKLLVRILARDGYTVHETATIEDAYATAESLPRLDVWVTDAHVDGNDASREVERFRALHPHLAVVLVSGSDPESDRVDSLDRLGVKFVAKPFTPVQLREAIEIAMRHGAATSTVVPIAGENAAVREGR